MDKRHIAKHYNAAFNVAIELIEKRARAILRKHPNLSEFISAMGTWGFIPKDKDAWTRDDLKYMKPVADIYDEWDDYLKLSGEPMRFTAHGPVVRDWGGGYTPIE